MSDRSTKNVESPERGSGLTERHSDMSRTSTHQTRLVSAGKRNTSLPQDGRLHTDNVHG